MEYKNKNKNEKTNNSKKSKLDEIRNYEAYINLLSANTNHTIIRNLFLRFLSYIYLLSFCSIYYQIEPLFGDQGIAPAAKLQNTIFAINNDKQLNYNFRNYPSISLFFCNYIVAIFKLPLSYFIDFESYSSIENSLYILCLLGIIVSIINVFQISKIFYNVFGFTIMYMVYFNFYLIGQDFFENNFDHLLLEIGFFACLLAPINYSNIDRLSVIEESVLLIIKIINSKIHILNSFFIVLNFEITLKYFDNIPFPTSISNYFGSLGFSNQKFFMVFLYITFTYSSVFLIVIIIDSLLLEIIGAKLFRKMQLSIGMFFLFTHFYMMLCFETPIYHLLMIAITMVYFDDEFIRDFFPGFPFNIIFQKRICQKLLKLIGIDVFINIPSRTKQIFNLASIDELKELFSKLFLKVISFYL